MSKPKCFGNYGSFLCQDGKIFSCVHGDKCLEKRNREKYGTMCKLTTKAPPPAPPRQPQ